MEFRGSLFIALSGSRRTVEYSTRRSNSIANWSHLNSHNILEVGKCNPSSSARSSDYIGAPGKLVALETSSSSSVLFAPVEDKSHHFDSRPIELQTPLCQVTEKM